MLNYTLAITSQNFVQVTYFTRSFSTSADVEAMHRWKSECVRGNKGLGKKECGKYEREAGLKKLTFFAGFHTVLRLFFPVHILNYWLPASFTKHQELTINLKYHSYLKGHFSVVRIRVLIFGVFVWNLAISYTDSLKTNAVWHWRKMLLRYYELLPTTSYVSTEGTILRLQAMEQQEKPIVDFSAHICTIRKCVLL